MKKNIIIYLIVFALVVVIATALILALKPKPAATKINAVALKGPTAIGMVKLMEENEQDKAKNSYNFSILGTADEVVALLTTGEADIAAIPANLAATLYNKTDGGIKVCSINTLGGLYILDVTDSVMGIDDLRGRTVYSVGKGTTPEFVLNYVLERNGLTPGVDVIIDYKSEATELAALLAAGQAELAMLPEPYVTTVLAQDAQNESLRIALSLTEEWDKVQADFKLLAGTLVTTSSFAENHKKELDAFLEEYKKSIEYVNSDIEAAAILTANYGIVPKPEIAKEAIPRCNVVYTDGDAMMKDIKGYLGVLFEADAKSVGGKLPDDGFYYKK